MKYLLIAITLLFAACDKPATPKIAETQREVLDQAKAVNQAVQQSADVTKQKVEDEEK